MAKRKKPARHGRSGDPRRRVGEKRAAVEAEATPELEDAVAAALAGGEAIDMVMLASSLVASLEEVPVVVPDGDRESTAHRDELPTAAEFVRMFLHSGDAGLHVLAWTVATLLPDVALRTEVDAVLAADAVPDWLRPLRAATVAGAWQATDPLRDATDVALAVRIGDSDLTLVGLIDLNVDGAVKDAFLVPAPLAALQEALGAGRESGMEGRDLEPADARAWLDEAVEAGRLTEPPFTSDSWPQARPALEWALRLCPPGGRGAQRRSRSTAEVAEVVTAFAATPAGAVVADPADRELLVSALQTLSRETGADPQLPSAVRLEIGLGYLWATALDAETDRLLALPDTLGPYVRWAHAQRGVPAYDTDEALAAIAHLRAEYVRDVLQVVGEPPGA